MRDLNASSKVPTRLLVRMRIPIDCSFRLGLVGMEYEEVGREDENGQDRVVAVKLTIIIFENAQED
jgi:hypothetical protein